MRALKWLGYIVGAVVVIILLAAAGVFGVTSSRMAKSYSPTVTPVPIPSDSASLARGRHIVESVAKCRVCHGDDYAGKLVFDAPVFARLTSSNLTAGKHGIAAEYTDTDWVRAIRYGVGRDGKSLLFMPSEAFTYFSDADLGRIIAYLKTLPAVDMPIEKEKSVGPIARIAYLSGGFPLIPASLVPENLERPELSEAPTAEYGEFLARTGGCLGCHGQKLEGGEVDRVKTPNLTQGGELGKWTETQFATAIRTGVRPDGRVLSAVMPWPYMKGLTDTEVTALWAYLNSVPKVALTAK